ncbi:MAG: transglycosylase SLT domain-containing protein [Fibrobacterota bacterium]|nr:transglycosylase SLT domain-containing protein [Fibrobacterota bacterium]
MGWLPKYLGLALFVGQLTFAARSSTEHFGKPLRNTVQTAPKKISAKNPAVKNAALKSAAVAVAAAGSEEIPISAAGKAAIDTFDTFTGKAEPSAVSAGAVQPPVQAHTPPGSDPPASSAPASSPTVAPPPVPAPAVKPGSSAVRAQVDSLLRMGTLPSRDDDSLAQAEADSGTSAGAKPGLPFEMKTPTRKEIAAFQLSVLNAVTAMEKKDYAKARRVLAKAQPTERLAQVYKTILMANVFMGLKDYVRADSVLQATLEWVGGTVWQNYLLNRRIQIFPLTEPNDSARLQFSAKVIQAPISAGVKVNFLYGLLRLQGFSGSPDGYVLLLKRIVASAPSDRRLDTLYQMLAPNIPPGWGTWELQDLMLDLESKLSLYGKAIARSEAALKLVSGKPEKQQLHWNYANLIFKTKDYQKAIPVLAKFMERYGETPEAILQIARCYDRMQEPKKAILWYDRLLEKYPRHDKTSEIYWLRAWDLEQQGNYEEAIEFYFRQLADFSSNRRGDWANFRIGLCQYKAGNAGAAFQAFKSIRDQVNSNAYPAGLYWEAKAQDSLRDSAGARATLTELTVRYPLNFYGHKARQSLQERRAWADSLEPWRRFAPSKAQGIKDWMKDGMSGFKERLDNDFESDYLSIGKLLQFRLDTLAVLTLRTVPAKVKTNPWFLYVHARMFKNRQLWREAYKLGLQLSYKIPPDKWGSAPREVLRLIFPRPYEGLVQKYAAKRSLDPALVYALMRQESGFDRDIKSGAGAIGLMQVMPATGKAVAKKERWSRFDPFSLTEAEVNISLGTAYLRDLKKDYQGNSYWVLANYNAGPEPTRRWQALALERPLEAAIEDISYWETRDYVKKVMGNYHTYRLLWNNRARPAKQTAAN